MQKHLLLLVLLSVGLNGAAQVKPAIPEETNQLAPLIGKWHVDREVRAPTGEWRRDIPGVWTFEWGLKGHAVIDVFETVRKDQSGRDSVSITGMNVRIYDPKEELWKMRWVENQNRKFTSFTAQMVDGEFVMEGKNVQGRDVRVYFYDIEEDSFLWRQEWTFDGGQTWLPVVKLSCRRM